MKRYNNVLLISNRASIWTKEFIDKVLTKYFDYVSILFDALQSGKFDDFYNRNKISFAGMYAPSSFLMSIPKIRVLYNKYKKRKVSRHNEKAYDLIIVLYATPANLRLAYAYKKETTKICLLFVGSDILRITNTHSREFVSIISKEKEKPFIVCESKQTSSAFDEKIGHACGVLSSLVFFGDSVLDFINKAKALGKSSCKSLFDMPLNKVSVCIGYNNSPSQQHIKVLDSLSKLDCSVKEKIFLIIPAAYGGSAKYKDALKDKAESTGIQWCLLDEFLDFDNVAMLRVATDIFINAQTTDSISASVIECYYAGALIVNISSLFYQEFADWELEYKNFDSFEDLCPIIVDLLRIDLNDLCSHKNKNREMVFNSWSWDTCADKWGLLFEEKL